MPNAFAYPRPEYPRPERQRGTLEGVDWLNLNGPWQFRFDGDRRGQDEGWHLPNELDWREQIIVPFCWDSLAAWGEGEAAGNDHYYSTRPFVNPLEVTRANHRSAKRYEVGWYRRRVVIPNHPSWEGKRVILTIGAADFFTDCWCNGKHLGRHEGGYTPFEFDLTDALQTDKGRKQGLLVVRVEDPMDNHEQPVGKQWRWYTPVSGIWQTVFVEPRSASHIRQFKFITDIDKGTVLARFECENAEKAIVRAEITSPTGATQAVIAPVAGSIAEQRVKIDPVILWDPNDPKLYQVKLSLLRENTPVDVIQTYFGMRKIDFAQSDEGAPVALRLNNIPRYLRGALYQSYHPEGVYTAGDAATLRRDIESAKRFGFNFLRIHIKIDDPVLLYYADKLGMLLMCDFPNFGEQGDTPLGRERFEKMMRIGIDRDFNHPSIFSWCMFNETWGFGGQAEFAEKVASYDPTKLTVEKAAEATKTIPKAKLANLPSFAWVQKMWELAKQLDPTRLVEDMSVCHWEHLDYYLHGDTDINSWHFYISDYQKAKDHIQKVVKSTFIGSSFNYVPGYHHKGQPLINSEYGGVGALDGDIDVSWTFKFLTNELRRHQQISAYIYTELHDVEWEYNGFLNYDRTTKEFGYDPAILNESNALPIDAPPVSRVSPGEVVRVHVDSSHYSTQAHKNVTLAWRMWGVDTRGQLQQDVARGTIPITFPHRCVAPAHDIEIQMPTTPMLCTLVVEACKPDCSTIARNFIHFFVSKKYPAEREELQRTLILRTSPGDWSAAQWSEGRIKRKVASTEDVCYGMGSGYFEWSFDLGGAEIAKAHRIKVLVEASSHRMDTPQTDDELHPTTFELTLNGIKVYESVLRNHPHDSRGVLSYWRGGKGAYGYLIHAFAEKEQLKQIAEQNQDGHLILRCAVPDKAVAKGGLTIYGAEAGRFPVCPTLIVDW